MPDTTPDPQSLEDLTEAISRLHPALASLEAHLRAVDTEAIAQQKALAESLDRIAAALDHVVTTQGSLLAALTTGATATASLTNTMNALDRKLTRDAEQRAELDRRIQTLTILLRQPA
jgi:chromosome segregation ATPase